jgi:hypothetical protein
MSVLGENQKWNIIAGFNPMRRICKDFRLSFLEKTEKVPKTVMRLGIKENWQKPGHVMKGCQ